MRYVGFIAVLDKGDDFPDPARGPENLPLAMGRELTPRLMMRAYRKGIFAWSSYPVMWWSPDPRAIMPLDGFHASRSLAAKMKRRPFRVTLDCAFEEVVRGCAVPRWEGDETWITGDFIESFNDLHRRGHAHSVECWADDRLVGGVFGIAINGFFSAESMFHRETDASKIALFHLTQLLRESGFSLMDIQVLTPHTRSLGGREIPRADYLSRLKQALRVQPAPINKRVLKE
ncbi:MAG: leucyl/phenylalanyl-tRNA--protein transferase [Acidobacteriota bacterium]